MLTNISSDLYNYIENEIIPRYDSFDKAHQRTHVQTVIEESLRLAQFYHVNTDMVYAIAAYHDTGLIENRERHHLVSGTIIRSDKKLKAFFQDEQIELMAQAAEDHRASSQHEPRSIYGKIVAEADRNIDTFQIVKRALQYGLDHYPSLTKEEQYKRFRNHMQEKYADGGYLKLWIPESPNAQRLEEFRKILRDEESTRSLFEKVWTDLQR